MSFWDIVWFIIISFFFIAYLMILFSIITDIFRDRELSGFAKAAWLVALVFLPLITALVYVVSRGRGMAERHYDATVQQARSVLQATGEGPADPTAQLERGKRLLDSGAISQAEYDALKARVLGGTSTRAATTSP
jgi:hypothetical protein